MAGHFGDLSVIYYGRNYVLGNHCHPFIKVN